MGAKERDGGPRAAPGPAGRGRPHTEHKAPGVGSRIMGNDPNEQGTVFCQKDVDPGVGMGEKMYKAGGLWVGGREG